MDDDEFNLYDNLDVFEGSEKEPKECVECTELREKLNDAQQQIQKLTEELTESRKKNQKQLETNCDLLITAREEIQRKDARLKDLQKEKDDICFRRRKPTRVQTRETCTQSTITCKPFICYEFTKLNDEIVEKSVERNHRRDETHAKNPFSSKLSETNPTKSNYRNSEANTGHRNQTRHQDEYSSSSRLNKEDERRSRTSQRNKDDQRRSREEHVDRSKRKRSGSSSRDRKRTRRSRSRSRSRSRRMRAHDSHERNSPDNSSRNQPSREKSGKNEQLRRRIEAAGKVETADLRDRLWRKPKREEIEISRYIKREPSEPKKEICEAKNEVFELKNEVFEPENEVVEPNEDLKPNIEVIEIKKENIESAIEDYKQKKEISEMKETIQNTTFPTVSTDSNSIKESKSDKSDIPDVENVPIEHKYIENATPEIVSATCIVHETKTDALEEGEINDDDDSNGVTEHAEKHSSIVKNIENINDSNLKSDIGIKQLTSQSEASDKHAELMDEPMEIDESVCNSIDKNSVEKLSLSPSKESNTTVTPTMITECESIPESSVDNNTKIAISPDKIEISVEKKTTEEFSNTAKSPIDTINLNIESNENNSILTKSEDAQTIESIQTENIPTEIAKPIPETIRPNNEQMNTTEQEMNLKSFQGFNDVLNTSGNKAVNYISTSSKDYLIVEDENDETTIYITRKKKKKKKDKKKNVAND